MALAHPLPGPSGDGTRWGERVRVATVVPLERRPDSVAAHVGEATLRARVRMDLLVARARAERRR